MPSNEPGTGIRPSWVVVANDSAAEIYARRGNEETLEKVLTLRNDESRERPRNLGSDRPGRSFDSHGEGRHALTRETGPKEQASLRFAKGVAQHIADSLTQQKINKYILISAPGFLGLLRKALSKLSSPDPSMTIDKDIVGASSQEILRAMSKYHRG